MTRYTLTIFDDARSILSTTSELTPDAMRQLRMVFDQWMDKGGVAVIADCRVRDVRQTTIELDLPPSPAEVRHERLTEDGHA